MWYPKYSSRVRIKRGPPPDAAALSSIFCAELRRRNLDPVRVKGNRISFIGGIFRSALNWHLLGAISSGDIEIHEANGRAVSVKYRLGHGSLLVFATALGFIWALAIGHLVRGFSFAFIVLAGGNFLISILAFRSFVKTCVRQAQAGSADESERR